MVTRESGAARLLMRCAATVLLALWAMPAHAQEQIEYYGLDALGSVRVILDAQGNQIDRMDYGPFGENLKAAFKFPTEQFGQLARDAESGQDYAQARSYSTGTGRFSQVDPVYSGLLLPQAWNRYAYALNNPLMFIDPQGLQAMRLTECTHFEAPTNDGILTWVNCRDTYLFGGNGGDSGSGSSLDRGSSRSDIPDPATMGSHPISRLTDQDVVNGLLVIDSVLNPGQDMAACRDGQPSACVTAVAAVIPGGGKTAKPVSRILHRTPGALQKGFSKHKLDFGLSGNWSPARAADYSAAIHAHINRPGVVDLPGVYRDRDALFYLDPKTALTVIATSNGRYITGFTLAPNQLSDLLNRGFVW